MFEGRWTKADGAVYANDDVFAVVHNGLMHLFSCIWYCLSDKAIESIAEPGQATAMLGM